jgi:hypothetical protein
MIIKFQEDKTITKLVLFGSGQDEDLMKIFYFLSVFLDVDT